MILRWAIPLTILAGLVGCRDAPPAVPQAAKAQAIGERGAAELPPAVAARPGEEVFPVAGIGFIPPPGWRAEDEVTLSGFLGRWLPTGVAENDWSQFTVEVRSGRGTTAGREAARFIEQGYEQTSLTIDGLPAVRLTLPAAKVMPDKPRASPIYVVVRGSTLYKFLFLLNNERELPLADSVVASCRWRTQQLASDHLELGPLRALHNGAVKLWLPRAARRDPSLAAAGMEGYVVFDYRAQQDALVIGAEVRELAAERTLEQEAFAFAKEVETQTQLQGLLRFRVHPKNNQVWFSESLTGQFQVPAAEGGQPTVVERGSQFAICRLHPTQLLRLRFVINREVVSSPEQQTRVEQAIDEILTHAGK